MTLKPSPTRDWSIRVPGSVTSRVLAALPHGESLQAWLRAYSIDESMVVLYRSEFDRLVVWLKR